jgi:hypothetical protein
MADEWRGCILNNMMAFLKFLLSLLYVIVFFTLPLLTLNGWLFFGLIFTFYPLALISVAFLLNEFTKEDVKIYYPVILSLGVYILAHFLVTDGGDGDAYNGLETFISRLTGKETDQVNVVPDNLEMFFSAISGSVLYLFLIINVVTSIIFYGQRKAKLERASK